MKRTVAVSKAAVLVEESDLAAEVAEHVIAVFEQLAAQGHEYVEVELEGDEVRVKPWTTVMVGWFLPDWMADEYRVEGGEDDLHCTFAFLGELSDLTLEQQRQLVGVVSDVVSDTPALFGRITEMGTFENGDEVVWFARPEIVGGEEFREQLVRALTDAGLPVDLTTHPDWTPHITVAYDDDPANIPDVVLAERVFTMDTLTVALAGERRTLQFADRNDSAYHDWHEATYGGDVDGSDYWSAPSGPEYWSTVYRPLVKSVVEQPKRFTLGPWYVPGEIDAHDEWATPEDVQAAWWGYVDSGDRRIRLQHMPDVVAGRWVEGMTLPFPMEVPVIDVNGEVAAHIYPAGTVLLGVIWEPWAWQLVVEGKITGYSIGGNAYRADEQPESASAESESEDDAA